MDSERFDYLTRYLAKGISRRRVAGGLLGALLAVGTRRAAGAVPNQRPLGVHCGNDRQCLSGICDHSSHTCVCSTPCPEPQIQGDDCECSCPRIDCFPNQLLNPTTCTCEECPNGQNVCDGVCVDLELDPANCGGCGVTCGEGAACCYGSCGVGWEQCEPGAYEICCGPGHHCCPPGGIIGCCPEDMACGYDHCLSAGYFECGDEEVCSREEECCIWGIYNPSCCVAGETCTQEYGCLADGSFCVLADGSVKICEDGLVCCNDEAGNPTEECCEPGNYACSFDPTFSCPIGATCCTSYICCPAESYCFATPFDAACCPGDWNGCGTAMPNCCPPSAICCTNAYGDATGCCEAGETCCSDFGCCDVGQTCSDCGCLDPGETC